MTEEGSVDQVAAHVEALVAKDRAPASLRANMRTLGRLMAAEETSEQAGEKALAGVPLLLDDDVPDREIQVLDGEGKVVRTFKLPTACPMSQEGAWLDSHTVVRRDAVVAVHDPGPSSFAQVGEDAGPTTLVWLQGSDQPLNVDSEFTVTIMALGLVLPV
jgi:hypothetical protein